MKKIILSLELLKMKVRIKQEKIKPIERNVKKMNRKQKLLKAILNLKKIKDLGLIYLEKKTTIDDYQKMDDLVHVAVSEDEIIGQAIEIFVGQNPEYLDLPDQRFHILFEEARIEEKLKKKAYLPIDKVIADLEFEIRSY